MQGEAAPSSGHDQEAPSRHAAVAADGAAGQGDLLVLAVPYGAHGDTLRGLAGAAAGAFAGKILVDITVPAKSFAGAKTRMTRLSAAERARSLFLHVMGVVAGCDQVAGVLVVTAGDDVAALARVWGAEVLMHPEDGRIPFGRLMDAALVRVAAAGGGGAALVLMADLPCLRASELERLLAATREHAVVIAPDRWERGTRAVAAGVHGDVFWP